MVHRTHNFWGFETGMITKQSLLEEQGLFPHWWFESRRPDRNKALVPRCPLSPSFKHASYMHYSPATICLLQEPHKISILLSISFSGVSWKRGMGIQRSKMWRSFNLTDSLICRQNPLPSQRIWAEIKFPNSSCSLCNFDSVSGYEFRTLHDAMRIMKHLYLLLFYGNISILRNNLLIT